ncbi:MAG TPA: sodium:calcium symporter [Candidatus Binatia bacterium]|nr:sodium:calcium symporter [Candidatus Binatia bacterium]
MKSLATLLESTGPWAPWCFLALFIAASFLMIWRLEAMSAGGVEGTVLGTLVMPYCSGMGNLLFAFVLGAKGGSGAEVLTNCLVNNVTNLTLLIGLPAIFWGMNILPTSKSKPSKKKKRNPQQERQVHRLSLLLTLAAALFFTGAVWALARRGRLEFSDGLVLVGLFLFWQCFHVFEVLKTNVRQNKSFSWMLPLDLALLAFGAYALYVSTDWLVDWISAIHTGFISAKYLGWLSGWLMVLPNGLLAFYYAWRGNPEVVYTSQVGDGHICIPLCIGIFALYRPIQIPAFFQTGMMILLAAATAHFILVALLGRLPRLIGWVLTGAYGVFLYKGLTK